MPSILHLCARENLRPIRDEILRQSGFSVVSTMRHSEALELYRKDLYDLVVIDVEGETGIHDAEEFCSEVKTERPEQLVAFVCNWRVAALSDCPDEIVRAEFDPQGFVDGIRGALERHEKD